MSLPAILSVLMIFLLLPAGNVSAEEENNQNGKIDIVQRTQELMDVVEDLRGLEFEYSLPVELVSPERIKEIIAGQLEMEITPESDRTFSALYVMLGLMPQQSSMLGDYQEMVEEQVAGLYDPHEKKFYVVDVDFSQMLASMFGDSVVLGGFLGGLVSGIMESLMDEETQAMMQDTIIVHELTHALDDQHFDIEGSMEELLAGNSDDAQLAYQSLLEGNAVRIQNEYTMDLMDIDNDAMEQLSSLNEMFAESVMDYNPFLERIMLAPYLSGEVFVRHIMAVEGENGINVAFGDPPQSMEQVLHPERYVSNRDYPSGLGAPTDLSSVLPDWTLEATDTLGELITGLVFELQTGDRAQAGRIGLGWDYDLVTSWRSPGNDLALAWVTVWDTNDDAVEFFDAYSDLLEIKYPTGQWDVLQSDYALYTGMGLAAVIETEGRIVVLVEGVPQDKADACLRAAWPLTVDYR